VELYDTQTGQVVVMLKGSTATTNRTAFSPDDREITTADDDGSIRVWNAATGKLLATLVGHKGGVKSVIWKSDGSQFLSYGDDSTWRLWSLSAR
jgi:WD40 repeat protein